MTGSDQPGTILLAGANRGLGLGLAREYLARGWHVIATVRDAQKAGELQALAKDGKLQVETLDTAKPEQAQALAKRLAGTQIDLLFIVAGQSAGGQKPVHEVPAEEVAAAFLVNSYGPPATAEALLPLLRAGAPVVLMTSVLGSHASVAKAGGAMSGMETYNATKSALNMLGIAFAQRHAERRVILMHPGWVKTDMGGENAPLDVPTSVRGMADVIAARGAGKGVIYVDYSGADLPW